MLTAICHFEITRNVDCLDPNFYVAIFPGPAVKYYWEREANTKALIHVALRSEQECHEWVREWTRNSGYIVHVWLFDENVSVELTDDIVRNSTRNTWERTE